MSGCGLIIDAGQWLLPGPRDIHDVVCDRDVLNVGVAAGPYPPFVFPVVETPSGSRVTGFDIQLVQAVLQELQEWCGKVIRPRVRLVPFRELFGQLHEGHLDFFLSGTPAIVVGPGLAGFGYSLPYLRKGGLSVIARDDETAEALRRRVEAQGPAAHPLDRLNAAVSGLTIAVQGGSSGAAFAKANLRTKDFIVCNSLQATFDAARYVGRQPDLIIGSHPVLDFSVKRLRPAWRTVTLENGRPLMVTHEEYSIVVAADHLHVRWFLNNLLFHLEEEGRLDQ